MIQLVPVYVQPETSAKLEKLALLAGSVTEVIERLITHWQNTGQTPEQDRPKDQTVQQAMWKTPNGDLLPVGQRLTKTYKGKKFEAMIEATGLRFNGELYPNPTAAGRAVKRLMGISGAAENTDGRTFWKLQDPTTGRPVTIAELNPGAPIDVAAVLAKLRALGTSAA